MFLIFANGSTLLTPPHPPLLSTSFLTPPLSSQPSSFPLSYPPSLIRSSLFIPHSPLLTLPPHSPLLSPTLLSNLFTTHSPYTLFTFLLIRTLTSTTYLHPLHFPTHPYSHFHNLPTPSSLSYSSVLSPPQPTFHSSFLFPSSL